MEPQSKDKAVNIYVTRKSFSGKPIIGDRVDDDIDSHLFPGVQAIAQKYASRSSPPKSSKSMIEEIENGTALIDRTEALIRKLNKKDQEIEKLCVLLDAMEPVPGLDAEKFQKLLDGDEDADFRDAKIVALAKKNRRLTLELQKARISAESRALQVQELAENVQKLESAGAAAMAAKSTAKTARGSRLTGGGDDAGNDEASSADKLNSLRKELASVMKSMDDMRRKNFQMSEEVKTLTRTLMNEVGDGVTLEQAVDSGWRGRAQQIIMMKSKVKRLEQTIANGGAGAGAGAGADGSGLDPSHVPAKAPKGGRRASTNVDTKAEHDLVDMSNDRQQAIETMIGERDNLFKENQFLDTKLQGAKARIRNLEGDIQTQKQQLKMVLKAKDGDDDLIDALQLEIKRLQEASRESERHHRAPLQATASGTSEHHAAELSRLQRLCKQQQEQINTQDEVIRSLRNSKRS